MGYDTATKVAHAPPANNFGGNKTVKRGALPLRKPRLPKGVRYRKMGVRYRGMGYETATKLPQAPPPNALGGKRSEY